MVTVVSILLLVKASFLAAQQEQGEKENMAEEQVWTEEEMDAEGRVFEIKKKVRSFLCLAFYLITSFRERLSIALKRKKCQW